MKLIGVSRGLKWRKARALASHVGSVGAENGYTLTKETFGTQGLKPT